MALSYEEQDNSFIALRDYMLSNEGSNNGKHIAKVVIEDESQILFKDIIEIFSCIETNDSFIDFFENIPSHYYQRYSTKYQKFNYDGAVLTVEATDKYKNPITISVSEA